MSISSRQIGWSNESNLIWQIAKELEKINQHVGAGNPSSMSSKGYLGLPSKQIGWSQESNLLYEVLKQLKMLNGNITPGSTTSTTTTSTPYLEIVSTPGSMYLLCLGTNDPSDVNNWNNYFDLPTKGTPFTSVVYNGNDTVQLYGGSGISTKADLYVGQSNLLQFNDYSGSVIQIEGNVPGFIGSFRSSGIQSLYIPQVTSIGYVAIYSCTSLTSLYTPNVTSITGGSIQGCTALTSISFPNLATVPAGSFAFCTSLTDINLPVCTDLGGTVGDDSVFFNITGNRITLTVPAALLTCNAGNPDGDIQYLQANDTVNIIPV